ncbi:uncharacterized protein C8Q71DRAFT_754227 [Rhodofomes roseus]|uniref:Uncharacterized protein n=1 Tax=Rhodofomes roseus TaxID=34475 RepID=A0ABQ8KIB8_9APHY|nr:uncharacterized protein C8Q71DRAFT_754227 [Rhodofomes roseus]KAH9837737.1 hypothetical protein C8Q71DRAFT_754227 [Rhodofomes roseus]
MGLGRTIISAAVASWARSSAKGKEPASPDAEDEMSRRPLLGLSLPPKQSFGSAAPPPTYGSTSRQASSSIHSSPERYRRDSQLGQVPEEGLEELDEEELDLEERGYYIGSYRQKVALYTFVPLSSLLVFVLFAFLPLLVWRSDPPSDSSYPKYFQSPVPELLVSISLWILSHHLRLPLFTITSSLLKSPIWNTLLFNILHVLLSQLLRLSAFPVLSIRHKMDYPLPTWKDPAFSRVWWIGLGWGLADVAVGITQGYEQLVLYREVMVPEDKVRDVLVRWKSGLSGLGGGRRASSDDALPLSPRAAEARENGENAAKPRSLEDAIKLAVDKDLEEIVRLKDREELEEIYGVPPIHIPVFVSCLQRIDSLILSMGHTLILSGTYLRSPLSFPDTDIPSMYKHYPFAIGFPLVVLVHLSLALLHSPNLLPRVGVHTMAYAGFLVGLGMTFAGLALWGALS